MINNTPDRPDWLRHALQSAAARSQNETLAIVALVVLVSVLIGTLYLAQATSTATTGFELESLMSTRDSFQRNNEDLTVQIARQQSIDALRTRAAKIGYQQIDSDQVHYLVVNGYEVQQATPTAMAQPTVPYVYNETFSSWAQAALSKLQTQFSDWMAQPTPIPATPIVLPTQANNALANSP